MAPIEQIIRKYALQNAYFHGGKAQLANVISKVIGEMPGVRKDMKELVPQIKRIIDEVNKLSSADQKVQLEGLAPGLLVRSKEERKGVPDIPNAVMGKVVTRIPPEPSKYPHLGHALSFMINYLVAKKYRGQTVLRFEDTNPLKVEEEFYQATYDALEWLGIEYDREVRESDHMETYYEHAYKMVELGSAYVCDCDQEMMRSFRQAGKACRCRERSIDENLQLWEHMLDDLSGSTLRLMGDMKDDNHMMRDPVLMRVVDAKHCIQGRKYRVWPMYDFAVSIEEELCGITHVLRSAEFGTMRVELQNYIRSLFGYKDPEIIQYTRFNIHGSPTKGRVIRELVEDGTVDGWSDPRLVTVKALERRGIMPQTIRDLTIDVGITNKPTTIDFKTIFAFNRKVLDPVSKRFFFVPDPVELKVVGAPKMIKELKLHPDADLGTRKLRAGNSFYLPAMDIKSLKKGQEFRLKDLYNVRITKKKPLEGEFAGKELKKVPKVQWVPEAKVEVRVLVPGLLEVEGRIKKDSLRVVRGYAESNIRGLKKGDIVQFERFGFCRLDDKKSFTFVFAHK